VPDALPDFQAVLIAALGDAGRLDHRERSADRAVGRGARCARMQMLLDLGAPPSFAVEVENQVVFGPVFSHYG